MKFIQLHVLFFSKSNSENGIKVTIWRSYRQNYVGSISMAHGVSVAEVAMYTTGEGSFRHQDPPAFPFLSHCMPLLQNGVHCMFLRLIHGFEEVFGDFIILSDTSRKRFMLSRSDVTQSYASFIFLFNNWTRQRMVKCNVFAADLCITSCVMQTK